MVSLELSGCSSSRSMASSFSISCPSTIASPAQSYHRRASFTNSFPTIQCRISDQRCVNGAAPLPKDQSLPITPVPLPVLHGLDTGTDTRLCIFSGTANPALSQEIAYYLGLSLGKIKITWCDVELLESVEGCNVFLVQPTCRPVDENLMELNFMIDACRKAYAKDITVVIPYFGYSRADKPNQGRESITARLVSKLIARARADRVVACDLHSEHLLGFFDISINNIYAQPVILDYLASKSLFPNDLVVVSPDVGGVKRARAFAKKMSNAPLAIIEKSRSAHNVAEEIAYHLGIGVGKIGMKMFYDEGSDVQLPENVEGCNVFLVRPTCPPVDENLMELCTMIDACRQGSAKEITAVIPYFGYARADQKTKYFESVVGELVSKLITRAGPDSILVCDIHSEHLMRYVDIPVENVYCQRVILDYLGSTSLCSNDLVVVSPDVGGVKRAQIFAKELSDAPLVVVDHSRRNHNVAKEIAYHLGIGVGKIGMKMFYDEESDVQLPENVEGCNVFLVRPICPPVDENLMEFCTMIDACRQGSAKEITAVIPYFGYARADQKTKYFESVVGELVSKLITRAGPDSILVCDIHSEHLTRYVDIPVENVYCQRVILDYLGSTSLCSNDLVVVSPDVGGVKRAQIFAKELSDAPLVVVDHSRRNHNVAKEIAYHLGIGVGKIGMKMFYDEESDVQLPENVEGCNVFLVRPTCPPIDENLMELCTMIDACRQGSAKEITVVIPYFGYARADQKTKYFESVAGELVSKLITRAGPDSILVCDIHSEHLMRYVDIPVENVYCQRVILDYLGSTSLCSNDLVVVSPDVGGVKRAQIFAKELSDAPLVVVDHSRRNHNVAKVINLIGDVRDKVAIMIDDIIDTANTMAKGVELLHKAGAREVYASSTHALLSPPAIERLSSGLFREVITTNTIPNVAEKFFPKLTVLSVANLLAGAIRRAHNEFS